ncbi:ribonuclease Z [Salinibius halmophilus]|uniref:ribonuclease Z n=1 Tax=Salinibius halmophilus TaxID=1853216 RepID=UPI000E66D9FD|nr:ribonuclease Z [Salinibius halmophilus]
MKILFLGTSSGVPSKQRNVTGIALREEKGKGWYLIDCGEATQHQILHTKLSVVALKAIFITHIHGDHCYGLPGLLASAAMTGRTEPLTIIAPKEIESWINATREFTQLYLPFELKFIDAHTLPEIDVDAFNVTTHALSHPVPSYGYRFSERNIASKLDFAKLAVDGIPKGELYGKIKRGENVEVHGRTLIALDYLITDTSPRTIVIAGDNGDPTLLSQAASNVDVLVHESTYTKDIAMKVGDQYGHSYAELVASFAEQVGVKNLILTHFSPRYQPHPDAKPSIFDIEQEARKHYAGRLFLAKDFAEFTVAKDGVLSAVE